MHQEKEYNTRVKDKREYKMCAEGETIQVRQERLQETQLNPPDNRSEAKGRETEKTKRHKTQDDKKESF